MDMTDRPKSKKQTLTVEPLPNPPHRPDPQTVPQTVRGNYPARQEREHTNGSSNGHKAQAAKSSK
ncbi:MAG: hypothetical protein DPW16_22565 [Chloroflexi bacterium]|nr:hypothetical protein [Chloroflexota bacterium]